jgi:CRISPR-associated protein Csb2
VVFQHVGGVSVPVTAVAIVTKTFRRALMCYCPDAILPLLSGHAADGSPASTDHLAILGLPALGSWPGSGSLAALALAFPRSATAGDRAAIARSVANWERAWARERPHAIASRVLPVHLGRDGEWLIERVDPGAAQHPRMDAPAWTAPARRWASVTPVALDRHPGDPWCPSLPKRERAVREVTATLERAIGRIGLPAPETIELLPAAAFAGVPAARSFLEVGTGRLRRCLVHARVTFATDVEGPVVVGAGRYQGLGLMAQERGAIPTFRGDVCLPEAAG